jgi:hypothetical protein
VRSRRSGFYAKYDPTAFEQAHVKKSFAKNWQKKNAAFLSGAVTPQKPQEFHQESNISMTVDPDNVWKRAFPIW